MSRLMARPRLLVLSCALSASSIAPAAAQRASDAVLPTITVEATAPGGGSLTVPSVTEQRRALERTPGGVTFIDARDYENRFTNNMREVLQGQPGVYVQDRYNRELRLSIRGSGITRAFHSRGIEILQDGIPTIQADGSGDYYGVDPLAIRSVEVYRGGNALQFGTSTLGGAVNFVSPTAYTAFGPNVVRVDGGSYGTIRANAQASRVLGDVDALVNATWTQSEGWRDHERQRGADFNGNVGYRFGPNLETRFYFGAQTIDQELPGSLTMSDALNRPRIATAAALAGDQARNIRSERIANRTSLRLEGLRVDIDTWAIHKDLLHPIFQVLDQNGWTYGAAPRVSTSFDLSGFRNDVVFGGRVFAGRTEARQFLNVNGNPGAQTLNAVQTARNYEAYGENRFFVTPQVSLITGLKFLRSERDYEDRGGLPLNPTPRSASRSYDGWLPRFGVLWEPARDVQVYGNVTRSMDVPDFSDLSQTIGVTNAFVPLDAQRAWTGEIGTRGRIDRWRWEATLYRSDIRGELLSYVVNPSIPASTFNAGTTIHQGVELGLSYEAFRDLIGPGDRLTLGQVWTYNDFRFSGDRQYGDNVIAGVPQHVLRTMLTYDRDDGLYVTPSVDWVPRGAFVDFANTTRTPSYALINLQTGFRFADGAHLYVDARNLADRRYISDFGVVTAANATTSTYYPGRGRSVFAGFRLTF